MPGPKKFWMPWRLTQSRISRKESLAKYDFRKSGGVHGPLTSFISFLCTCSAIMSGFCSSRDGLTCFTCFLFAPPNDFIKFLALSKELFRRFRFILFNGSHQWQLFYCQILLRWRRFCFLVLLFAFYPMFMMI